MTIDPQHLLVTGSGARFAERLSQHFRDLGWEVTTVLNDDPLALPPTAALHIEQPGNERLLLQATADADAVLLLGGVGPIAAVVGDVRSLDIILGNVRPGTTVIAVTSLAVFGVAGHHPITESDTPDTPAEFDPARVCETRVLMANDWLRGVVVRPGHVYGDGGGELLTQAVDMAAKEGVSRYFGEETDSIPTPTHRRSREGGDIAAWTAETMTDVLGVRVAVPRVNVNSDVVRSRATTELGWTPAASGLQESLGVSSPVENAHPGR